MLSLIIENYEKEIQRRDVPDSTIAVVPTESQNQLQNVLTLEKDQFRAPIFEEKDVKRCSSICKDTTVTTKKKQKKSKGRSGKRAPAEKHIKGLVT